MIPLMVRPRNNVTLTLLFLICEHPNSNTKQFFVLHRPDVHLFIIILLSFSWGHTKIEGTTTATAPATINNGEQQKINSQ